MMSHDWRVWAAASLSSFIGTTVASIANAVVDSNIASVSPSTVILVSGAISTIGLGLIALYQKLRQTKRAEDIADNKAFEDSWKLKYENATRDAAYWQENCERAEKGSAEWERLYREVKNQPKDLKQS